jgi:hypothetical protein
LLPWHSVYRKGIWRWWWWWWEDFPFSAIFFNNFAAVLGILIFAFYAAAQLYIEEKGLGKQNGNHVEWEGAAFS